MLISRILVLALTIAWSSTSPMEAQSIFDDDFSRPDGSIANGWTVWGNLNTTLAGGEVRTFGSPGVAGGIGRTLPVSFPIHFSFDFRTLNTNVDPTQVAPYNDGGWLIAFNASSLGFASPAQVKFYQYAGSLKIIRETSGGITEAQPKLTEPIRGWQDFTALPAHVAGTVNADLSASITVTYANGVHVSASFASAASSSMGPLLLLGNSNRSNGPHILDNIKIESPVLERVGSFAQVASGGGWKTTMALINPSATEVAARIDFYSNDGRPLTLPLSSSQSSSLTTDSFASFVVAPNASVIIETDAVTSSIAVGWADVRATAPLSGYSIFRMRSSGSADSEGTVPLDGAISSGSVLPYDNSKGFRTGVALANQGATAANIGVLLLDQNGTQIAASEVTLDAFGHTAFFLDDRFLQSANRLGFIQFQNADAVATIGLRFNPSGSFTSVPIIR